VRELSSSISVKAPAGFALAFLNTYVRDLVGAHGDSILPMRYTLTQMAGLTLERAVAVRVEYVAKPNAEAELNICWEPDATLFPSFTGTLNASAIDAATCELVLAGTYDAPGGVAGQLFDAVIGVRIAQGTLDQLVAQFRDVIEADYRKRMAFA
jgi:hypothetical protein